MTPWRAIPVDLGGPEGRALARAELADPIYAQARPPWWQRATDWLWDHVASAVSDLAGAADGLFWVLVLGAVVALVAVVVARRVGWVGRRHLAPGAVFADRTSSAAEHRAAAERAAAGADWTTATLEGFRALVRGLEERGAVDPRPGRTADEAVAAAGAVFPAHRLELSDAARSFDELAYGGRAGTADTHRRTRELDAALSRVPVQWPTTTSTGGRP